MFNVMTCVDKLINYGLTTFQNSLPIHFFNTIGHVTHRHNYHPYADYKQHLSVPYHFVNSPYHNFNLQPQHLLAASVTHPMSFESILKAPDNFRDSALYTNDPSDPMFLYNVPPPRSERLDPPQTGSNVNMQQQQPNYDFQPSYTNIQGMTQSYAPRKTYFRHHFRLGVKF